MMYRIDTIDEIEERVVERQSLCPSLNELESRVPLSRSIEHLRGRIKGPLLAKLGDIIEELGKDNGFTMILRRGAPGLLYAREALDVTDLVIEKYNESS